jgi:hypothetical protein
VSVKSDLAGHTLVAAILYIEPKEPTKIVDEVLQSTAVLVAGSSETFLNIVPDLTNFSGVLLEELSESLPWGVLTGRIIQVANQGKNLLQADIHNRL